MAVDVAVAAITDHLSLGPEFLKFKTGRFAAFEEVAEPAPELGRSHRPSMHLLLVVPVEPALVAWQQLLIKLSRSVLRAFSLAKGPTL